jgi:hypothetical protein
MTVHGQEEMEADGLTVYDVELVILTGEIIERQKDEQTAEPKYVIEGDSISDEQTTVVAKIGPTGWLVIVTVYLSA